jgi:diguanylate cyclase (GGDEF)-like protein
MVFLIGIQVIFILDPLWELVLNVVVMTIFSYLVIRIKPVGIWQDDVANAAFASLGGMFFSWHMSRVVIKEMRIARRLEKERNRFEAESILDELTGLGNRRDYLHRVDFYVTACQRVRQTVCVIMMDVDHFKLYNDFYGHLKGDQVLKALGGVLARLMAEEKAFAARVGGEEFIVLWTENRLSEAQRLTLKLRQMVIDLQIPHEKSPVAPYITASFGLYFLRGGSPDTAEELYERADQALYEAKHQGRNCIMLIDSADNPFRRIIQEDERVKQNTIARIPSNPC